MNGADSARPGRLWRSLGRVDAWLNRLYTWRYNPLYQSGTLAVGSLVVLLVTGVYLLFFYRLGSPYASVAGLAHQAWAGRWVRSLHRYASDVALVAALIHGLRMFLQRRRWGARALAWVSGLVLVGVLLVCGWTGYVMVWDTQGQVLATEGARLLDLLPVFSEPLARTFVGERPLPGAFFFLNLFLHIALPIGVALVLWIHVARVARPVLLPPRRLLLAAGTLLLALAILYPAPLDPPADLFRVPGAFALDLVYGFFLPLVAGAPAWAVWVAGGVLALAALSVPLWSRPGIEKRPLPSVVEERFCTGCEQCFVDCPYEAIRMIPRSDGREGLVARVDPGLCVSCGICAGSCAPMGVGPPLRTGRDQLERVRAFMDERAPDPADVVIVACDRGAGGIGGWATFDGAAIVPVSCAGSLHTSVVEILIRRGMGGVLVASCSPRDCWNREGPVWLEERLYHEREAELQERVDRRRVGLVFAGPGERGAVASALTDLRESVRSLAIPPAESTVVPDLECEIPATSAAEDVS